MSSRAWSMISCLKIAALRTIRPVCRMFAIIMAAFAFIASAQANDQNMGTAPYGQPNYSMSSMDVAGNRTLTGAAGMREACALLQEQSVHRLRTELDKNFQNKSLLSGRSYSKLESMVYAQGASVLNNTLHSSCAALTGSGGESAVSGLEMDTLQEMVYGAAFAEGLGFLQSSGLPFMEQLEVSGNLFGRGGSGWEILTVQPLWHDAPKLNHIFTQLSWNRTIGRKGYVDGDVLNAGLGYRRLSNDKSILYGLNAFIDHSLDMNHNRMSVGVDMQTAELGVSANKYIPLSDWKSVDAYKEERASSGFDLELNGRLPELPSWQLNLKGYQWSSNQAMEDGTTWGYDVGVQWQPVNALVWEAGVLNEQDSNPQFHTQLRMVYKFGESLEQMWERPVAITDMSKRVYDKVRRDNAMRVEQRVKDSAYVSVVENIGTNTALLEAGSVVLSVGRELPRPFTVTTGAGALTRLAFRDGAVLTIGAGSQVRVEADIITLISGLFQYVSGPTNVSINIPGGTVALLGTDIDASTNGATSILRVRDGVVRLTGAAAGALTINALQAGSSVNGAVGGVLADADPLYTSHTDNISEKIDRLATPQTGAKVAPYPYKAPVIVEAGDTVGDMIKIGIEFNTGVTVSGTPQLAFTINNNDRVAAYSVTDSTAERLVFAYTLQASDAGAASLTTHDIHLNGGSVMAGGKGAVTTMSETNLALAGPIDPGQDDTPDAFNFTDVTAQALNAVIISNAVTINGIGPAAVAVSVSGDGNPQITTDGGATWGVSGTINNGGTLQVRLTSANALNTLRSASVTVGTVSDQWDVTTMTDPCAVASPVPGTICADGTFFAGFHPVNTNVKIYAMRQDAPSTMAWNNGASPDTVNTSMPNCPPISDSATVTTGVRTRDPANPNPASTDPNKAVATAGCYEGQANTSTLANYAANASTPYIAASYCAGLEVNALGTTDPDDGPIHDDWYLPSINELSMMFVNLGPQPNHNFLTANYWSSSEASTSGAWSQIFTTGTQSNVNKGTLRRLRCIRQ